MRLDKYLADANLGTRSELKKIIRNGKVSVDGIAVLDPAFQIKPDQTVQMEGQIIAPGKPLYYMFHKPAGCVCATRDREKTVLDYFPPGEREKLFPVGRLDKDTEGLLLLTDDGSFAHRIISPKKHIPKLYYFEGKGCFDAACVEKIANGMDIGDETMTLPAEIAYFLKGKEEQFLGNYPKIAAGQIMQRQSVVYDDYDTRGILQITEGRYHQVKRMLKKGSVTVIYLKRLSIGSLYLDDALAKGTFRALTPEEMKMLGV